MARALVCRAAIANPTLVLCQVYYVLVRASASGFATPNDIDSYLIPNVSVRLEKIPITRPKLGAQPRLFFYIGNS